MRPPVRDVFLNAKDSWRGVARIYRPTVCLVARKGAITRNYSVAPPKERYGAIVVGAGPAGIATVGNLLDSGVESVKWLDPSFNGGRLNAKYREVPSNTKVKLFVDFVEALKSFRFAVEKSSRTAYQTLKTLQPDKGCKLKFASEACLQLTEGLKTLPNVHASSGVVESAVQDESGNWKVKFTEPASRANVPNEATAELLVLCTGSYPTPASLPAKHNNLAPLDLDVALSPSQLSEALSKDKSLNVAIIGASHSAILVLRNLYNLASSSHPNLKIKWFSRHSLRYAEQKDGWILRDNTGLKGEAAQWAKDNLEPEVFAKSDVSKYIQSISTAKGNEEKEYEAHLPSCDFVVEAVGFTRAPIPALSKEVAGGEIHPLDGISCDHTTGGFINSKNEKIPGLYGAGIAWPERVTDPAGHTEMAVGMWKFMRYLKKVVPEWKGHGPTHGKLI